MDIHGKSAYFLHPRLLIVQTAHIHYLGAIVMKWNKLQVTVRISKDFLPLGLEGWDRRLTKMENVLYLLDESFSLTANCGLLTICEQNAASTMFWAHPFPYFTDLEWFIVMGIPESKRVTICFPYSRECTGKGRVLNSATVFWLKDENAHRRQSYWVLSTVFFLPWVIPFLDSVAISSLSLFSDTK